MSEIKITKLRGAAREEAADKVADEIPFTIILDDKELATLLASPTELQDLARGFLFTSGLIAGADDVKDITVSDANRTANVRLHNKVDTDLAFKRLYTPGCGSGTLFYTTADLLHKKKIASDLTIDRAELLTLMKAFSLKSDTFRETGGVHSAALCRDGAIALFREDIGRHNAVDKIIGASIEQKLDSANALILTSGRLSSEIVLKIQKFGAPVLASRGAATDQAVRHAKEMNLTLVGFARGDRCNIYSGEKRIL